MISEEKIAEIRQSARISDFISPHIALKRRGRSLMGLCPFHNEKTPSFSVSDQDGFFHCFGCGAGGNVFKFLMLAESLSFPEAARKVAARYGITVPETLQDKDAGHRQGGFEANASAAQYFHKLLVETEHGSAGRDYLRERGVAEESIERFCLGVSPASGNGLVRWFTRQGVDLQIGKRLGLVVERGQMPVDRFRQRLMFPIRDAQGRVAGFGGRLLAAADAPKYVNSPESEVYHKSRALYGLYEARDALRTGGCAILVEGYLDVVALHQNGIASAVATCGTALTVEQARILRRLVSEAVTLFDGDAAGERAAARSFPILVEAGLWPRGAALPVGEDPDTYVRKAGAAATAAAIREARPLAEAYVRHVVTGGGEAGSALARAASDLSTVLRKIDDPFEYDLLLRKVALWTGISEDLLRRQGAQPGRTLPSPAPARRTRGGAPGPEELLVTVMLADPGAVARVDASAIINSMEEGLWKSLVDDMIGQDRMGHGIDPGHFIERLPDDYRSRVAGRIVENVFGDPSTRARALEDCIRSIGQRARRRHNADVLNELRKREQLGVDLTPAQELANLKPRSSSDA